jgi:hypothetical protein
MIRGIGTSSCPCASECRPHGQMRLRRNGSAGAVAELRNALRPREFDRTPHAQHRRLIEVRAQDLDSDWQAFS